MKTKFTELKNGEIKFEIIPDWERIPLTGGKCYEPCGGYLPPLNRGCLVISYNHTGDPSPAYALVNNPAGALGNGGSSRRALHGWLGTHDNRVSMAYGWRAVISVTPRKRGGGFTVLFSVDLKPNHD